MRSLLSLGLASVAACLSTPSSKPLPTAVLDSGAIVGTTTSLPSSTAVVKQYLGIPFGAPPVRFSPPRPVPRWSGFRNATTWGPACIQEMNKASKDHYDMAGIGDPLGGESEDCLNLNVFTPADASVGSKPVLVWIYGGGFINGGSALPIYDGTSFATNQDVVVVTFNYRTNVFGFPGGGVPQGQKNLGFLDQRLALDWVQRNIASLGGDPLQVTIMGESAGGGSVDALVTSPPDPLPFRAAIMESNQASIVAPLDNKEQMYPQSWKTFLNLTHCPTDGAIECLRKLPAQKIKKILDTSGLPFGPLPDGGVTLSNTPREDRLHSTEGNSTIVRVPVLFGNNADEAKPYVVGANDTRKALEGIGLGKLADTLIKAYPLGQPSGTHTENDRISLIANDLGVHCPMKFYADDNIKVNIPAWRYLFNASFPNSELFPGSGAYHMAEIRLVFGTYEKKGATGFQAKVSHAIQTAWADFAKDPFQGPGWEEAPTVGVFGDGVKVGMDPEGKKALRAVSSTDMDRRCHLYESIYV
ncbi:putative carboxylesterase hlo [Aspergillus steynii IBT 23096]|uniref:Putative carboxylesterase hlo n=1 Tax=Aspergillus steynii IBT 23096 TaxID=1392250 RepID=A0A2I2GHE2_9EURO|nr:putative carboxylesterase hlo [Aspergillus steynii IBT 23096]PLB52302.1 putative carboxylesterase hlo [Aspergillus steynii IBT 23096]